MEQTLGYSASRFMVQVIQCTHGKETIMSLRRKNNTFFLNMVTDSSHQLILKLQDSIIAHTETQVMELCDQFL